LLDSYEVVKSPRASGHAHAQDPPVLSELALIAPEFAAPNCNLEAEMSYFRQAFALVARYRKAYLVLNAIFYGFIVAAMVYGVLDQPTQQEFAEDARHQAQVALPGVVAAYEHSRIVPAIALTFIVNFVGGSLLTIVLPSLVIPFSGLCLAAIRAVLWGLIFAPTAYPAPRFICLGLLLLLEGQGYVLAMLAAYIQGSTFLGRETATNLTLRQRYWAGVKRSLPLHFLIAAQLAIAAIYEVLLNLVLLSGR
jgi:hypothetical protein